MKQLTYVFVSFVFFSCGSEIKKTDESQNQSQVLVHDSITSGNNDNNKNITNSDHHAKFSEESECIRTRKPLAEPVNQTFNVNVSRDTILRLERGINVLVPAGSIKQNGRILFKGRADIEISSFQTPDDFVLGDLATVDTKGNLIETSGSIKMNAVYKGKPCDEELAEPVTIFFPQIVKNNKPDMIGFTGVSDKNGFIGWSKIDVTDLLAETDTVSNGSKLNATGTRYEQFMDGKMSLEAFMAKNARFSPNKNAPNAIDKVYLEFVVGTDGKVGQVKSTGAEDYLVKNKLENTLRFMPRWKPFLMKVGTMVSLQGDTIEKFQETARGITFSVDVDLRKGIVKWDSEDEIKDDATVLAEKVSNGKPGYVLKTKTLGYINCDRFRDDEREKVQLAVNLKSIEGTEAFLIFTRNPAVMRNVYTTNSVCFQKVPIGEPALFVLTRKVGSTYTVFTKGIVVGRKSIEVEKEETVTLEELRKKLKSAWKKAV